MIKAVTIDDEEKGRTSIKNFISKYAKNIQIVGEADGVLSGIEIIAENKPELVFLDIQMNDGTGFDLLEKIPELYFNVVFVTAYDQFALKAFKYSAVDYLLKPVNPLQIIELDKKISTNSYFAQMKTRYDVLLNNKTEFSKIALPTFEGITMAKIDEIIRCESDNNYTSFYFKSKERLVVSKTIKEYEELFGNRFFRIHNSHLINLSFVDKYLKEDGGAVLMEDGTKILISRRRKNEFLERLLGS